MRHATTHSPSVTFDRVTVGYRRGEPVLRDLTLSLDGAGLVHLTGSNGSGKSTVLEVASGYLRAWEGEVRVCGQPAPDARARRHRRVCRTKPALYPSMTARDHIAFAARRHGVSPAGALRRADAYGLSPWLQWSADALSTGNRRKLWIVMTTVGEFDVVLLDEPYNGLDEEGSAVLTEELRDWARSRCVTLVAHALPDGLRVGQRVDLEPAAREGLATCEVTSAARALA